MKLTKIFALLTLFFTISFLMAGCADKNVKTGDDITVETDETVVDETDVNTQTNTNAEVDIATDFEDNSIDSEIELGELI